VARAPDLVLVLLSALGDELASLPVAVRALIISGVVVTIMTTFVMPALNAAVRRGRADDEPMRDS
jgi:antibiotic biosynthesis monooxygenase (ABM) superfamily enzyme